MAKHGTVVGIPALVRPITEFSGAYSRVGSLTVCEASSRSRLDICTLLDWHLTFVPRALAAKQVGAADYRRRDLLLYRRMLVRAPGNPYDHRSRLMIRTLLVAIDGS